MAQIFSVLLESHRASLTACSLVSRAFASLAGPVLYSRIHVSQYAEIDSRRDCALDRLTAKGNEKRNTRKKKLLAHVKVVRLDAHHSTLCKNKAFNYPKLEILTLRFGLSGFGPVLHLDHASEAQCHFIKAKNVRPKKLVLDGVNLTNLQPYPIGIPGKLYDHVEELVFICPPVPVLPAACEGHFPRMKKLKKVTWMFYTSPGQFWTLGTEDGDGSYGGTTTGVFTSELSNFATLLSTLPPAVPITIVNAGSLNPDIFGFGETTARSYELVELRFIDVLKSVMIAERLNVRGAVGFGKEPEFVEQAARDLVVESVKKRFEGVGCMRMRAYLEEKGWVGELKCGEARAWLGAEFDEPRAWPVKREEEDAAGSIEKEEDVTGSVKKEEEDMA